MTPEQLVAKALEARERAYAPYSDYAVGAALLAKDGRVFTGCNVENASFGLTCCAERTACFKAVSEGAVEFTALAVATRNGGSMCGACRQVMNEFGRDLAVHLADESGAMCSTTLADLLPGAFGGENL